MNPLQKALIESMNREFSDVPSEQELDFPTLHLPKRPSRTLRRCLLIAAAVLLLAGIVFATRNFSLDTKVETGIYGAPEIDGVSSSYHFTFQKDIVGPNAPDEIKTFMLPTAIVSEDTLNLHQCRLVDEDSTWMATSLDSPLDGKIQSFRLEWHVDGSQIYFKQRTTVSVNPEEPLNFYFPEITSDVKVSYETVSMGAYEVFCFHVDYSACERYSHTADPIDRWWFWTDGDYLYELFCEGSQEKIQQLFESIAPLEENVYSYLSLEESQVSEIEK